MTKSTSDLHYNLVAFVCDPVSEHIIVNFIKETGLAYSDVRQGSIEDIVEFLKNNKSPKILIADISNLELPLGDIAKINEYASPNLNVIAIGSRNDVGLFRDLIAIGVSDYIVKPLNNNLLHRSMEKSNGIVNAPTHSEKTGKMFQFISSVGGAGATTVASNIGWILANRHFKRSIVMDMDFFYGTLNLMLDIKAENAYLDILESPEKIDDYFVETILKKHDQRLYYLGGLADLVRGINVDIKAFEALMTLVKKQFNYLLVDTQRDPSNINKVCMNKSDIFIILVEMSIASAQNTARLLEFLSTDQPGKKSIIVANKVGLSSGGSLGKDSFEKVIDKKIDYMMPLDESITLAAANIGQPLAASTGPLTDILETITDEIIGKKEDKYIKQVILEKEGWTTNRIKAVIFDIADKIMSYIK